MSSPLSHFDPLESESIHVFREAAAQLRKPVLMYSIGKDSTVLLHLARKAFWPQKPPFPLLHIDTTWKPRDMITFHDSAVVKFGLKLIVHTNRGGLARNINQIDHAPSLYTEVMKTQALKQALDAHGFDVAFGGARRDEEASRAQERVFSFRFSGHRGAPRNQRPKMWRLLSGRLGSGESARIFPLSNWTERDVWRYIQRENLDVVPLYLAAERPVIERNGQLIVRGDNRMPLLPSEAVLKRSDSLPNTRLLADDSSDTIERYGHRERRRQNHHSPHVRAERRIDQSRSVRCDGAQKIGRLLLMSDLAGARSLGITLASQGNARFTRLDRVQIQAETAKPVSAFGDIVHVRTCGSVDDGKSTLIGRLLWGSTHLPDDYRDMVRAVARRDGHPGFCARILLRPREIEARQARVRSPRVDLLPPGCRSRLWCIRHDNYRNLFC
jgi:sulfate adenylyltransferase subunit 2